LSFNKKVHQGKAPRLVALSYRGGGWIEEKDEPPEKGAVRVSGAGKVEKEKGRRSVYAKRERVGGKSRQNTEVLVRVNKTQLGGGAPSIKVRRMCECLTRLVGLKRKVKANARQESRVGRVSRNGGPRKKNGWGTA